MNPAKPRILRQARAAIPVPLNDGLPNSTESRPTDPTIVRAEQVDAHRRAKQCLDEARALAQKLVEEASAQASAVLRAAEERVCEDREHALAEVLKRFDARAEDATRELVGRSVELARLLAERLIGSLAADSAGLAALAEGALREVRGVRRVRVEIGHADPEGLCRRLQGLLGKGGPEIEVQPSPDLGPMDLRMVTDLGVIDARLAVRLDRIMAALRSEKP